MVTIINKSNKPVGVIGGLFCLPDQKLVLKDKDAYCAVFDEDGNDTGKKMILPGLKALEGRGYISIEAQEEKPKEEPKVEVPTEEEPKAPKKTTRKKSTKKAETEDKVEENTAE